jgi:diaminopimelate epimerase
MLQFFKIQGSGNDFVVTEARVAAAAIPGICDRNLGVGADGVLMVTCGSGAEVTMEVYNPDGSRPEMCGNGVRCVAWYGHAILGLPEDLTVMTDAGARRCRVYSETRQVAVDMGVVVSADAPVFWESLGKTWEIWPVDVGNPHAVVFSLMSDSELDALGSSLNEPGSPFERGVNLERAIIESDRQLRVDVFERGVGRTLACGTGACAAVIAGRALGHLWDGKVDVVLAGGTLEIALAKGRVWMTGAVEPVFRGEMSREWMQNHGME